MEEAKGYKKLQVWQKGYQLALLVYEVTDEFPKNEEYGLKLQLRRCAVSIPSNIAEGYMRQHTKEYIQFLSIALGSVGELETQGLIARDRNMISLDTYKKIEDLSSEVGAKLTRLIQVLKTRVRNPEPSSQKMRGPLDPEPRTQ